MFDLMLNCWIASPGVNDRQKGHTDEYTGESVLGTCFLFHLGKPSAIEVMINNVQNLLLKILLWQYCNVLSKTVQVRQDGHDAWFVEFAEVEYF